MRDAESRFARTTQRAGAMRSAMNGSAAMAVSTPPADGSGAPATGGAARRLLVAITASLALVLCFGAGSASAAFQHQQSFSFGPDGTNATSFSSPPKAFAFQQAEQRLYVYAGEKIYAFHRNGPSSYSPVGGAWPLSVNFAGGDPDVVVDNSSGATKGNVYYTQDGGGPFGFTSAGVGTAAFEPAGGEVCGMAVASDGKVWDGNYGNSGGTAEQFSPAGGSSTFTVHSQSVCDVEIDRSNNDLYTAEYGTHIRRFTAASGYSAESEVPDAFYDAKVAINPIDHLLYTQGAQAGMVKIYDTNSFGIVEEFATSNFEHGIAVDDASNTVYLSGGGFGEGKVEEWRAVIAPTSTTGEPVGNSEVSGSVALDGGGEVTQCNFEFATENSPAALEANPTKAPCEPAAPYTSDQPLVTAALPGLEGETTYYYRITARNANAVAHGLIKSITPHNVKALKTEPATGLSRTTSTLNATYEGTSETTEYWFEWELGEKTCPCPEHKTTVKTEGPTTGTTNISDSLTGLTAGKTYSYRVVGKNSKGESKAGTVHFTTDPAVKGVVTKPATEEKTTTALVHGELDPDNYETTYFFEWGKDTKYGQDTPLPPGTSLSTITPGVQEVTVELTNLEPGTEYHYRLVAKNETGETFGGDQTLMTKQGPSITSFSVDNVTATNAELTGTINPNGYATTYWFEYGFSPAYEHKVPADPETEGQLPGVNSIEPVVEPISGLEEKTYHFRLVAESEWGRVETEDQTFDFNVPLGCPNQLLRQQTGAAYLPDCRAYELVSAANAGGAAVEIMGPTSPYASNPSTFVYAGALNIIPGAGEPQNASLAGGDPYVATRTSTGWVSKYIGPKGSESLGSSSAPGGEYGGHGSLLCCDGLNYPNAMLTDRSMKRFLIWDRREVVYGAGGTHDGTMAPRVYDNEGNWIGNLPTGVQNVPGADKTLDQGGWIGSARLSGDASHYLFSSINLAFTENGLSETPGSVYDNDIAKETITLISKTESGEDIPEDTTAGVGEDFLRVAAASEDGSHILISSSSPPKENFKQITPTNHLYMAINDGSGTAESDYEHFDISVDKTGKNVGVKFETMTDDGSKVFLTTDKQMTADDEDTSVDLYMWSESTHSLTRISDSGNLPGNTDACTTSWDNKCDVSVVPRRDCGEGSCASDVRRSDFPWASQTGEIYFFSPEELDGARGFPGKRNLYVYRGGRPQYVATFEPAQSIERINVSPDGQHMAFITRTQMTAYNNTGHSEMYLYDPAARTIKCVSCVPSGESPHFDVKGSQNGWFMSFDGRTFFSTKDGLVDRDANKTTDVYEYFQGRPQLISTGTGSDPGNQLQVVGLISVSGEGLDAIFGTYDTLVPQDENGDAYKIYDARSSGGFATTTVKPPCAAADECHGEDSSAPAPPEIGSGAHLGAGGSFHIQQTHKKHKHKRHCKKHKRCHKKHGHKGKGSRNG